MAEGTERSVSAPPVGPWSRAPRARLTVSAASSILPAVREKSGTAGGNGGEWFEGWFDETYLELYRHRDEKEALRFVRWLGRFSREAERGVVDLACGAGRHAWAMAREHRWRVTGLDLSRPLLRHAALEGARGRETAAGGPFPAPRFIRCDLRSLPVRDGAFGLAVNLFTSFGYFTRDEENLAVLAEMARVLHPGGILVIDVPNPGFLRRTLVPRDTFRRGKLRVEQRRRLTSGGRRVNKEITIWNDSGEKRVITESVRLLDEKELDTWLARCGLHPEGRAGDEEGGGFDPASSPRMITWARKPAR